MKATAQSRTYDDRRISLLAVSYQLDGVPAGSEEIPRLHQTWSSVAPGTIGESLVEHCCENR